ncbi:MAG: aspartate--tRNA ligase [Chloroflexi bacterium]|nr:MAG: aspartate--tRNA ligase [Chloroflexota bacterium]
MSGFTAPHCGSLRGTASVAADVRGEYVVRARGTVRRRPAGSENPKLATGDVEVDLEELEVISKSKTPPFEIEDDVSADEATRLKYRYLDLRRPKMARTLELRHRVVQAIHRYMSSREFIEIETPMLLKGTPEGSRDFIVPSRLHPGEFFALPQSPQQLKQLLMVAGIGRYYQIARCLRDEDLRADRVVEITQLDVEMSFCTEEDVLALIEGLWASVWKDVLGIEIKTPFPRIDMQEALLKYGSDKPDLRYDLVIADVSDALRGTSAMVFRSALDAGGVVRCFAVPGGKDMSRRELDELALMAKGAGAKGLAWIPGPLDRHLAEGELSSIMAAAGAGAEDLVLLVADRRRKAETVMGLLRREIARRRKLARQGEWQFLWVYPMYLFEEDDQGNLTYGHHPFTSPWPQDMDLLGTRPYDVRARAYDCVLNGVEVSGGSIRIHDRELQERVFEILGMSREKIRAQFGHLLDAFEYGVPPHGGIAAGIDRLMMAILGTENIRDVVAFPKTQSHQDLMLGAPSAVDQALLDELHIKVVPPTKPS